VHFGGASEEGEAVEIKRKEVKEEKQRKENDPRDRWRGIFVFGGELRWRKEKGPTEGRGQTGEEDRQEKEDRQECLSYWGRGKISRLRRPGRTTPRKRPSGEMLNSRKEMPRKTG